MNNENSKISRLAQKKKRASEGSKEEPKKLQTKSKPTTRTNAWTKPERKKINATNVRVSKETKKIVDTIIFIHRQENDEKLSADQVLNRALEEFVDNHDYKL